MSAQKLYTAKATSIGGRKGHVETDDKRLSFDLTDFSNTTSGTNPEQLFASGYSACFGSAIDAVAKKENITPGEIKVTASIDISKDAQGGFFLAGQLDVSLEGIEREQAERLVRMAHQVCPYSKATRGNIEVKLLVDGRPLSDIDQMTG